MKDKVIKFVSYDGYKLEGTLIKAHKEKGAALFVHGITSSRDELGFHSEYAKFLSDNGITTFRFDYRYHGVNESKLQHLSLCGIVNDIDAAFSVLIDNLDNIKKPLFIIGTSFGGGLSAFWANRQSNSNIKKLFLNAPVINYENDVLERNDLLNKNLLSPKAQNQLKRKEFVISSDIHFGRGLINELKYVNGISAIKNLADKVVIFHGNEDDDVPLSSSKKYKTTSTQLEIIKGVGHGFGVDGDEDLDFPETKKIHADIYRKALKIMEPYL